VRLSDAARCVPLLLAAACGGQASQSNGRPADSAAAPAPTPATAAVAPATRAPDPNPDRSIAARTLGAPQAPITIYEVSDFQCPYCRDFARGTLPDVKREYVATGKIRIVFINFPIPELHKNAEAAHELAMCAAEQAKFWPVHDLLYRHQDNWAALPDPRPFFYGLADSARLGRDALRACLMAGGIQAMVRADKQAAVQAGVRSTPSFIINGALLAGAVPMKDLRPILDSMYRAKTAAR
jgi:protein-disulfide isomerase